MPRSLPRWPTPTCATPSERFTGLTPRWPACPALLPSAAGLLLHKEVSVLSTLLEGAKKPFVVVLGGSKVSDKLGIVKNLLGRADSILIGGAMANTFLAAEGHDVGKSRTEGERLEEVKGILAEAESGGS